MSNLSPLEINRSFSSLFRRMIPKSNILFLGFMNKITTPYGKDANGLVSDSVFLPSILRIKTMEFKNVPYLSFNTSSKLHKAGGFMLNVFKFNAAAHVDSKLEIADVNYHVESMVQNASIDAIEYLDRMLMSNALSKLNVVNASNGTASSKTYKGGAITERSIEDEIFVDGILLKNNAKFLTHRIEGTPAWGSSPIPLSFIEITSVEGSQEIIKTYQKSGNFVSAVQYSDAFRSAEAINMQRCEVGFIKNSNRRIYATNNYPSLSDGTIDGGTDKVYSSLILGAEAFSVYMPTNRLIDVKLQSNIITSDDTNAEKIRLSFKLVCGLTDEIYGHALHYVWLGAQ